jgi:hypothetical protein
MSLCADATRREKSCSSAHVCATVPPLICGRLIIFILELSVGVCGGVWLKTEWLFGVGGAVSRGEELRGGRV